MPKNNGGGYVNRANRMGSFKVTAGGIGPLQIWAVVAMAITVGCLPALMPILLGALLDENRITPDQVGQTATAEALGRVLANVFAGALLRPVRLRAIAAASAVVMTVTNFVIIYAAPEAILLARFCNGIAAGMILWMLVGLMARVNQPGQLFAIFATVQSVITFLLSSALTSLLIPNWGSSGGYLALALLGAVPLALALLVPGEYPMRTQSGETSLPTAHGLIGLCAVFLFMAGIFALWVYVGAVAKQVGHASDVTGRAISYAIGIQIVSGLAAMRFADRWSGAKTTAMAALGAGACALALLSINQTWALYASIGIIAFLWMFTPAFHLPLVLQFDQTGRSAIYTGTAQLGGIAAGPLLASVFVQPNDYRGAVAASVSIFVACALILGLGFRKRSLASPVL